MKNTKTTSIRPASIKLMQEVLDIIYNAQRNANFLETEKIATILNKSNKSIENAVKMLRDLNILTSDQGIVINDKSFNKLNGSGLVRNLICDNIILFPLFNEYVFLLRREYTDFRAATFLKYIFNISTSEKIIRSTFNSWIRNLKIDIIIAQEDNINYYNKKIKTKIDTLVYIREKFDKNLRLLPEIVLKDLIEGIITIEKSPDNSITDTGRALENFLRLKYKTKIVLKDCNGIGQISNKLFKNKLICMKHNNIIKALGSIRSIGDAHGLDKDLHKQWEVKSDSALIYNNLTIKLIASIIDFTNDILSF